MGSSTSSVTAADLAFCVSETNRYRAMGGVPSLVASAALEAFAAEGARVDAESPNPHTHVTRFPNVAAAENEAHRVTFSRYGSVRALISAYIANFWNEGPGGGHYQNLIGPFTRVGRLWSRHSRRRGDIRPGFPIKKTQSAALRKPLLGATVASHAVCRLLIPVQN